MGYGSSDNLLAVPTLTLDADAEMIADLDIWRAANLMIERHGTDAAVAAAQRADEMLAKGNVEGQLVWKRILDAINELQWTRPAENAQRH